MSKKVFGAYDIRGIYGQNIDCEFARQLGQSFGSYICPKSPGNFLVGHDARLSSPELADALCLGLSQAGHQVTNIGLASTPLIYWYGAEGGFDGSVTVTASHLPPQHNGFKLCRKGAETLSAEDGLPDIEKAMGQDKSASMAGQTSKIEAPLDKYISRLVSLSNSGKTIKVAVDGGTGVAGPEVKALFANLPNWHLVGIGLTPDGVFPERSPNPLDKGQLDHLIGKVREEGCSFGAAFDGDADRIVFVDEQGNVLSPDLATCLLSGHMLKASPGATVLYDLRASRVVPEYIATKGGIALRTCVGHSYIKRTMRQTQAVFAGELSGHFYFSDMHSTDNAMRALIEMMNLLSDTSQPLSALVAPLQKYASSGEINLHIDNVGEALARLESCFADGKQEKLDGLSVDYSGWWFNARASQTEPILRLTVEAEDKAALDQHVQQVLSCIEKAAARQ